jgi:Cof subfamily protein (haloacid dehalogenase superfamily)
MSERWLIALDIDGTLIRVDGSISDDVVAQVQRVRDLGHEVMLATGRSAALTLPVLERFDIAPRNLVVSNGAITLGRDVDAPAGYSRIEVETFDPSEALLTIQSHLDGASYAVEDETGIARYSGDFSEAALGANSERVSFEELLGRRATRVVVSSPGHDTEEFLSVVERMGLHKVTYNVGWTAWLDIAPDGVNKATALERVRARLGVPRANIVAIGDGRNDIDMLLWASAEGRGIAMGQAPDEVRAVANEVTGTDIEDGVASVLASF